MEGIPAAPTTLRMLDAPPREPDWVSTTSRAIRREIRSYFHTAWAFGWRPRETARAWADGRFKALNPLAYLLNSLAIIGPWRALWQRILKLPDLPLAQDIVLAAGPFIGVLAVGSFHHLLFRLLGSKRRIQSGWAIAIYSTGGFPTLLSLVSTPIAIRAAYLTTPALLRANWHLLALSQVVGIVVLLWQNAAVAGLYGTSRKRAAIVQLVSSLAPGLLVAAMALQLTYFGVTLSRLVNALRH